MNKEKRFEWNDELVQKFAEEYRFSSSRTSLEQFVKCEMDKLKEEEKPTISYAKGMSDKTAGIDFTFSNGQSFYITKERLAEILIAESKGDITIWRIKDDNICPATNKQCDDECCPPGAICNLKPSVCGENPENDVKSKLYTEKEMLNAREESFNAGRLNHCLAGWKYDTFSDFMNSQK